MTHHTSIVTSLAQLETYAQSIQSILRPGMIIGLQGQLGAGKTTFVKVLARQLGIRADVISPTFVYEQVYEIPNPVRGILRLHHLDLYRLTSETHLSDLGIETDDPDGVYLVEWIEHAPRLRSAASRVLLMTLALSGTRTIQERS